MNLSQIESSLARKHQNFYARVRNDLHMLKKSTLIDRDLLVSKTESEIADILDSRVLIYPSTLNSLGLDIDSRLPHRKLALGLHIASLAKRKYVPAERSFLKCMETKAENGRKANWQWRISNEAEEKQRERWYPFFVTLTVNPTWASPERLWKEGREFRKYIRRLVKIVCRELGHPPAHKSERGFGYRPESDYVTYAGVIEHGKSQEHHHGHFIIWMREIPSRWKVCPNEKRRKEARTITECKEMRRYWKWSLPGLSISKYFRTIGDVWSTDYNFCTPIDEKTLEPMRIGNANAVGRYVTKYMQKGFKKWHHRMKATRNLGLQRLKKKVALMSERSVEALTWRPKNSSQLHSLSLIHSVPLGLVRLIARQQHYLNRYKCNQLDWKELLRPNYGSFTKMLRNVRRGTRPDRMHSLEFYDWVSEFLPDQKGFCEELLFSAHSELRCGFPRTTRRVEPVKIGGNNIGLTYSI